MLVLVYGSSCILLNMGQAEGIDTELRQYTKEESLREVSTSNEEIWSFPLSSWAYYYKLRQMEWIVQMGFELDIYQVDELAGMYWCADMSHPYRPCVRAKAAFHRYLQHLASTRLQHLERIRTFSTHRLKRIAKPTLKQKTSFRRSFSFLDFATLEASATQSFAEGLFCVSLEPRPLPLQLYHCAYYHGVSSTRSWPI